MIKLTDVQNKYLAIDFFLTMSCNKDCHYCTSYTLEQRNLTVDMEFLERTLYYLRDYKTRCNLLGGEPGLIKNLPDDDPKQRQPDISLAKKLLNWEPQVGRAEGMKRTFEYFKGL